MDLTLIPFALRQPEGAVVAVDEVPAGHACDCICPSCGAQLHARHGRRRAWHFAHASRADSLQPEQPCKFSWAVSVRLMARQVFPALASLQLPQPVFPVFKDGLSRPKPEPMLSISAPDALPLDRIQVDAIVEGLALDLVVDTPEGAWAVYLSHRGTPAPESLSTLASVGFCAITIDLHGFAEFIRRGVPLQRHRAALANFLSQDIAYKHWAAHPALEEPAPMP